MVKYMFLFNDIIIYSILFRTNGHLRHMPDESDWPLGIPGSRVLAANIGGRYGVRFFFLFFVIVSVSDK